MLTIIQKENGKGRRERAVTAHRPLGVMLPSDHLQTLVGICARPCHLVQGKLTTWFRLCPCLTPPPPPPRDPAWLPKGRAPAKSVLPSQKQPMAKPSGQIHLHRKASKKIYNFGWIFSDFEFFSCFFFKSIFAFNSLTTSRFHCIAKLERSLYLAVTNHAVLIILDFCPCTTILILMAQISISDVFLSSLEYYSEHISELKEKSGCFSRRVLLRSHSLTAPLLSLHRRDKKRVTLNTFS